MRKRRQELYDSGPVNDGNNDNLIIVGVVAVNFMLVPINLNTYTSSLDGSNRSIPNCLTPEGGTRRPYLKDSTIFYTR